MEGNKINFLLDVIGITAIKYLLNCSDDDFKKLRSEDLGSLSLYDRKITNLANVIIEIITHSLTKNGTYKVGYILRSTSINPSTFDQFKTGGEEILLTNSDPIKSYCTA